MPRPTSSGLLTEKCDAVRKVFASIPVQRARIGKGLPQFGNTRPCARRCKQCDSSYRRHARNLERQGIDSLDAGIGIALLSHDVYEQSDVVRARGDRNTSRARDGH